MYVKRKRNAYSSFIYDGQPEYYLFG
uniref:Defensin 1 n=1 Tax=Triatoma infestans TaxID=30076 RepID=A0A161MS54_TRIIF